MTGNRVQAHTWLVKGKDDDLIRWLQRVPHGRASQEIKRVLRVGLGLGDSTPSETATQTTPVSSDENERRIRQLEERMEEMRREIARLMSTPFGEQIPVVEAVPQVTDETLALRRRNLDKQNW